MMGSESIKEFNKSREEGNKLILDNAGTQMKRLFHVDGEVYKEGVLSVKQKELMGLVASLVLRCDDCISYHIIQCKKAGVTIEELMETLTVGYTVAGSITIPHMRRALKSWKELSED